MIPQREINFRAWHKEQKRMFQIYGLGVDFITEQTLDGIDYGTNAFCGDDLDFIEVLQYTGVKDKNGKEIYEGDIIFAETDLEGKAGNLMVVYNREYLGYTLSNAKQTDGALLMNVQFWGEVIGNIYQNPELLATPTNEH